MEWKVSKDILYILGQVEYNRESNERYFSCSNRKVVVPLKSRLRKPMISFICVFVCAAFFLLSLSGHQPEPRPIAKTPLQQAPADFSPESSSASSKIVYPSDKKIPLAFEKLQKKYNLVAIPTYDGSYQLTHPKVLYFAKGWNGYKYWMSMTPYPYGIDDYENPSIVVSNDGKTWNAPQGLKNPVSGLPPDVKTGGHYSDPQLVMRGNTMELWYRYNPQKHGSRYPDNGVNIYFRRQTRDGIHWSAAQKLRQSRNGDLSLCVLYENGLYRTWYASYGGDLCYTESRDALTWSTPVCCKVPLPAGLQSYHQDIIKNGSDYYLLQTAEKASNYTFQLFLLKSEDGIHFTMIQPIAPSKDGALWKNISFYRSTVFVKDNKMNFYISLIIPKRKWYITRMEMPMPKSLPGEKTYGMDEIPI